MALISISSAERARQRYVREALFDALELPHTRYNARRLTELAKSGHPFEAWLVDVDYFFPRAVNNEERLFLGALSGYFDHRDVVGWRARLHDIQALMGVRPHPHNLAAIDAWLGGHLSYVDVRSQTSRDRAFLGAALC